MAEPSTVPTEGRRSGTRLNVMLAAPMLEEPQNLADAARRSVPTVRVCLDGETRDAEVDIIIVDDHARLASRSFPRLSAVFSLSAGVDQLVSVRSLSHAPIYRLLTEQHRQLMREYVVGQLLASLPSFREPEMRQRLGLWAWLPPQAPLAGRRVVLLGLGFLGEPCAKLLSDMGMAVTGFSRSRRRLPGIEVVNGREQLHSALADADFLVCLLPLTEDTRGLIGRRELALMPQRAVVVNASRAGCVNEDALVDALRGGTIAAATIDVFEREPLANGDPMWSVPNLRITPHCAATPPAEAYVPAVSDALRRCAAGAMPANVVDRDIGY